MSRTRLRACGELVCASVDKAAQVFELAAQGACGEANGADFALFDYARGVSTDDVEYELKPARTLVRVPLAEPLPDGARIVGAERIHHVLAKSDVAGPYRLRASRVGKTGRRVRNAVFCKLLPGVFAQVCQCSFGFVLSPSAW